MNVAVTPERRRQGIASMMMNRLFDLTSGRGRRGYTLEKFVDLVSTNAAKIMGLYPRKGAIEVGGDADLAIFHPSSTRSVSCDTMETNADWSPFEGWDLAGFARTTLSRGEALHLALMSSENRAAHALAAQFTPRR